MTTIEALTQEQRTVLARYASGATVNDIVKDTRLPLEKVDDIVTDLAGFDRGRAGAIVRQHDNLTRRNGGTINAQASPLVAPIVTAEPKATRNSTDALLAEAEATGDRWLVARVEKVRILLGDIRARLDETRVELAARAEIARLEAELAAAKARLKGRPPATAKPAADAAPAVGPSPRDLREWANKRGLDCPSMGKIPTRIRDAWAAEQEAAA